MKRKLLFDLSFFTKICETCTSNYLQQISFQSLCIFGAGNILSNEKNLFDTHGAFEKYKTIDLLIGLLNQDSSGWN